MRLFWSALLVTGLVLVGVDVYERHAAAESGLVAVASEDGTPMPYPNPPTRPKTR